MIESPVLDEAFAFVEARSVRRTITRVLLRRFGSVPESITSGLQAVTGDVKLDALVDAAADCPSMEAFEDELRRQY